jgi:type VI secretion system protein ImpA
MGLINSEKFLSPVSTDEPAGPNLEYDAAFTTLERAAQGKPEQRMGDSIVPAEPPDWASVVEQALALLDRTRDLRVAVHLALALLHRAGYPGLAEGLGLVRQLLAEFWPTVHPELDHEDNDDPTMRITALAALATPSVLQTLRSTALVRARALGVVSLQDIQALSGDSPSVDAATVEGVLQEVELEALQEVAAAVEQCSDAVTEIDAVFEGHTGSRGPDLTALAQVLRDVSRVLGPRLAARTATGEADEEQDSGADTPGAAPTGDPLKGEIRSRDDVVRAIDKICAYYARFEPTSPLPLLLERCRRLVSSSFMEIIKDLAPDSVARIESLAGKQPE